MAEQTLIALEFPELIKEIQAYASSALGRTHLAALRPISDYDGITARLQEISELGELIRVEGPCPLVSFPDLAPILRRVKVPGSLLEPGDFLEILAVLQLVRRVRRYFVPVACRYPLITRRALQLQELASLHAAIRNTLSPHGLVLDQASLELQHIREKLARTRQRLSQQLHRLFSQPHFKDALQDRLISQRNGRSVIPIKAEFKGRVRGIIHDQSHSKATLFIEPFEVINLNNRLNLLANEEKREEERLLRRLTEAVREHQEAIQADLAILGELDALQALALYGNEYQARPPILTRRGQVRLKQARHPLLLARERQGRGHAAVVPVDLELTPERHFLVISGANAGGKTVTLKTLGLLSLMVQCGIPIPVAEGSELCIFDRIFADIGDTQNLAQDLSTFSAHIKRIADILAQLQGRCLVLLDELGTATDPAEGSALALALLKALARAGAYGAITTHYHLLKVSAREEPFENVSVLFDEQTKKPLYRLAYGVAGPSNALEIARDLGLASDIIAEAEHYLGQEGRQARQLLAHLEALQQSLVQQEQELAQAGQALAHQEAELAAQRELLRRERQRLCDEDRHAVNRAIKQAEAEFKELFQRLNRGQESWGRVRQELSRRQSRLRQSVAQPPEPAPVSEAALQPGTAVVLTSLGRVGTVMSGPDKEGRVEVLVGTIKLRVPLEQVEPSRGKALEDPLLRSHRGGVELSDVTPLASPTLNIIGLRVEEALPLVDRLIDQAALHGCSQVDIIHGIGTGRLRQAVQEHLRTHVLVKQVHSGEFNPRGQGVTTVDIKE